MGGKFVEISDLMREQASVPLDWNESGKALLAFCGSEDTLLNLQNANESDARDVFEQGNTKKSLRTTSNSMPDLSARKSRSFPRRSAPGGTVGSIVSTASLTNGRTSPVSGGASSSGVRRFTLKDYELELDELRHANFNLKIRIWHLEGESRRRGRLTDDLSKRDLESQISELMAKLEEKERMLKESLEVLNQIKANCNRQLAENKYEHDMELDATRQQFNNRIRALENDLQSANEQLQALEMENLKLNQLASGKQSTGGESDSDASMISQREKQIFDLKSRVAMLERDIQASGSPNREMSENRTLSYNELEIQALKDEINEKNELMEKVHSQVNDRDDFIAKLRKSFDEKVEQLRKLDAAINERNRYIATLESNIDEKNQFIGRVEADNERLNARLEELINSNHRPINNSDDEKLRHLEEELHIERANTWKHMKIIESLIKELRKQRPSAAGDRSGTSAVDVQASAYLSDEDGGGDIERGSSFMAWLNETTTLQLRQHDDVFRRRVAELQTASETFSDRLNRIVGYLEEYICKLRPVAAGMDSSNFLSAVSSDLSRLRNDVNKSLENATFAIVNAVASRGADTSERIQSELSRLVDSVNRSNEVLFNMSQGQNQFMDDRPEISELNVSNISRLSGNRSFPVTAWKQPPPTMLDKSTQAGVLKTVSDRSLQCVGTGDDSVGEDLISKTAFDALLREKEKYERYAKKLKAMYRKLARSSVVEGEAALDQFLEHERRLQDDMDAVFQRLERNTFDLGEHIEDHGQCEKALKDMVKQERTKTKELQRRMTHDHRTGKK